MAAGLEKNGRARVQAIFSHAAGDNSTLLSFSEGDVITLLVPEARDGWHYGENEKNKMWVNPLVLVCFCLNPPCDVGTVNVADILIKVLFCLLRRGWFPFSYTRVLPESDNEKLKVK